MDWLGVGDDDWLGVGDDDWAAGAKELITGALTLSGAMIKRIGKQFAGELSMSGSVGGRLRKIFRIPY
tara:strand:- start:841 stop:1044 length:204 start_codon:yes stop_codon:yes gene_type:complete